MVDSITGFIFSAVSHPALYVFLAVISFINAFNVAKVRGGSEGERASERASQLYMLFGIVYLAFAGILWRMAQFVA